MTRSTPLLIAAMLLALSLLPAMALAQDAPQPVADDQKPAVEAAKAWLAGIDAGRYADSWTQAAAYFRGAITEDKWVAALTGTRGPLGGLASRTLTRAQSATSLPGAPDGSYVVMEFAAAFANKKAGTETVTFMREPDGTWRAVGYFIR